MREEKYLSQILAEGRGGRRWGHCSGNVAQMKGPDHFMTTNIFVILKTEVL